MRTHLLRSALRAAYVYLQNMLGELRATLLHELANLDKLFTFCYENRTKVCLCHKNEPVLRPTGRAVTKIRETITSRIRTRRRFG
jgi:hypothetical protein